MPSPASVDYALRLTRLRDEMLAAIAAHAPTDSEEVEFAPFMAHHDEAAAQVNVKGLRFFGTGEIELIAEDGMELGEGNSIDGLALSELDMDVMPTVLARLDALAARRG